MQKLCTIDNVDFIIGGFRSESVLAMQEVAAEYKKLWIAGSSDLEQAQRVKKDYNRFKYFFRGLTINSRYAALNVACQISVVQRALKEKLGITKPKMAMIADKNRYADLLVKVAEEEAIKAGCQVTKKWRTPFGAGDLTAELTAANATGAHILWGCFAGPASLVASRQWGELNLPMALLGINTDAQKMDHWKKTNGLCNHMLTWQTIARVPVSDKSIPFYDKFVKRYGSSPMTPAMAYDVLYILKAAIEEAGTLKPDPIVKNIEKINYLGACGKYTFDDMTTDTPHDLHWGPTGYTGFAVQWQNGQIKTVWPDGKQTLGDDRWVGVKYGGTVDYQLPPRVINYWKNKVK
jgi:branched-chain amino acid transport system substrate-binding protein